MPGFDTKREMAAARYADMETVEHIIDLRKKLAEAEMQRDNALSMVNPMRKALKMWMKFWRAPGEDDTWLAETAAEMTMEILEKKK